jgi:Archaeal ATPase.
MEQLIITLMFVKKGREVQQKRKNPEQTPKQLHIDLGDAPEIFSFYDRTPQLTTLENWITQDRTRLIALLGISGIGKTTLSLRLIDQIKNPI